MIPKYYAINAIHAMFITFYIQHIIESTLFYKKIFARKPVAAYPTYVAFFFENGCTFSLWSIQALNFVSDGTGHRSEHAFMVEDEETVRELRKKWGELNISIEQDLLEAVFGLTFVALDPDRHRIRVCIPDK